MKNPFDELNSVINSTSTVHDIQTFFSNFNKQHQAKISKKLSKSYAAPLVELLIKMSK